MDRCNLIKPSFLPNDQLNVPCIEQSNALNQFLGVSLEINFFVFLLTGSVME